jgi:hypothetical protein
MLATIALKSPPVRQNAVPAQAPTWSAVPGDRPQVDLGTAVSLAAGDNLALGRGSLNVEPKTAAGKPAFTLTPECVCVGQSAAVRVWP